MKFSLNKSSVTSPLLSVMTGKDSEEDIQVTFSLNEGLLTTNPQMKEKDSYLASRTDIKMTASNSSSPAASPVSKPRKLQRLAQRPSVFEQC
jgi:hypothetical protein